MFRMEDINKKCFIQFDSLLVSIEYSADVSREFQSSPFLQSP